MRWLALLLVGPAVQRFAEARDRRQHPPPGVLVPVGDATVHVVVRGSGPVVLCDSGLGGSCLEWTAVAEDLAADFTVVTYDRPGFAWSPGSSVDRRAEAAAARLLALLDALDLGGPVLLVGHSLGGVHVRVAAARRPDLVGGLVLVDPSHERMLEEVGSSRAAAVTAHVMRAVGALAPTGVGRVAGRLFAKLALGEARQPLSEAEQERAEIAGLLTSRTTHGLRALAAEHAALAESLRQLASLSEPDLPMVVITAAAPSPNERVAQARATIDALHADLVAGRSAARNVLAPTSGHLVPLDDPQLIARCVRETSELM